MRTLIVATDFSKEAENAIEYAGAFAKQIGTKVILFNSFSLPIHATNTLLPASAFQELISHNNEILKARALKLSETYFIEVGYESCLLDFDKELDGLIKKYNAGMVVMGMAAKSFEQDLFGNTTTSLIMKLKYPVLAVPIGSKFEGIKTILFACDMLHPVHQTILDKIKEIALGHGAEVEIFHVHRKLEKMQAEQKDLATANSIDDTLEEVPHYYKNIESAEVIKELEKEIIQFSADLLIMVPNKYAFPESLIHKSKTRVMASNNKVPLLSIPI